MTFIISKINQNVFVAKNLSKFLIAFHLVIVLKLKDAIRRPRFDYLEYASDGD